MIALNQLGQFKNGLNFSADSVSSVGCDIIGIPNFENNYIVPNNGLKKVDPSIVTDEFLLADDDILFVRSNGNKALVGRTMIVKDLQKPTTFSGFCIRFRPNVDKVNPLYMLYLFKSPVFRRFFSSNQQTSITNLNQDVLGKILIDLPALTEQNTIARAIHCLTQRIENNNEINDNLQQELCLIYEHIMSQAKKGLILGTHAIASELSEITTGREDANFADTNGKYKFFTCSSETLKCNHYAFNSSSILIAGNGEFNVKHFSGKFNAYQRTYVLTPKQEYYGLLYLACLYQIKSFKSSSAGSIVKFITKGDIDDIPVFIPDDGTYLIQMNKLLDLQEMRLRENEKLLALRDFLLPLLMNGQATIAE